MSTALSEYKAGREVILTFNKESGNAIFDACDFQDDGVCLAKAASIIRKELINITKEADFDITRNPALSIDKNIEEVSQPIYSFINMILNGSDLIDDQQVLENKATLTIIQLLRHTKRK